jgi:hypothetical protein
VHEDAPVLFETRWALSYLRGPLTRNQIKTLMDARRAHTADQAARPAPAANKATAAGRPILPPQVPQRFLTADPRGGPVVYEPRILGSAQVHFIDTKTGMNEVRAVNVLAPVRDDSVPVEWEESSPVTIEPDDLELEPVEPARFAPLPATAANPRSYAAWSKTFAAWLYATQTMELYRCPSLKLVSNPGESAGAFRVRVDLAAREERDRELEKLRQRYAPKLTALEDRLRRARQTVDREREQAQGQTVDTALAIGSGLLGALFGRKVLSTSTVGKATGAARSWNRSRRETQDVARASETLEAVEQQIADLEARLGADTDAVAAKFQSMVETIETLPVRAKKTNISVRLVALAWAPAPPDA